MTLEIKGNIPDVVKNTGKLYEGNLVQYLQIVFNYAENLKNPYHNFRHMCHVLWLCYRACDFYRDKLTPQQMRNLLIAALFHDFDHTGKYGPDIMNIKKAISGFVIHVLPEDKDSLGDIIKIIKNTEYPYTTPSEKLDIQGKIIRDTDISQALSVAWIQQVVFGLSQEWDKTPIEVLKIQVPFLNQIRFNTEWAKKEFPDELIASKITEAQELYNILTC